VVILSSGIKTVPSSGRSVDMSSPVVDYASPAVPPGPHVPSLGGRIPSLDGLRALSILLVIIGHVRTTVPHFPFSVRRWATAIPGNASLGVSIFFVISGFLITHLLLREQQKTGRISLPGFYVRRFFRIMPAYYTFLICLIVLPRLPHVHYFHWLKLDNYSLGAAALFITNYSPHSFGEWVGHTWSLSVEEQFYILWPTALVLLGPRRGLWLAGMILIACPILRFLTCVVFPDARFAVGTMTATRADTLMFGCAAALLQGSRRFERICDRIDLWRMVAPATLLGFVISPLFAQHHHPFYNYVVSYSVEGLAITVIMLWLIRHADSVPGRILNAKPVVHIGVISYSLYLWQQLFLAPPDCELRFPFPASILFVLAAAEASHFLVEQPFVRLGRRFK
jgi:peptidoglycan/LPS O-acetylase OafA/YrhL